MITPRTTRLVRVADLQAFREALVSLACDGPPLASRDRLVVVPTRAAAAHLLRAIEDVVLPARRAVLLPDLVTPGELVTTLASRLDSARPLLGDAEREVLLAVAARRAVETGAPPPFRLRPGLIAGMLRFYDELRLYGNDVDTFERRALAMLEPGVAADRGAERLVRQTRFLVAAFREFERRSAEAGWDEHDLRRELLAAPTRIPYRHVVVTVSDRAVDRHGLASSDWDLLARLPGLERLDLIVTDTVLAGALHERLHRVLPGMEEIRFERQEPATAPVLLVPGVDETLYMARDREEEVAGFARRVRQAVRSGELQELDRMALVVHQPLPYVYVAREVLKSAGIPCQLFDALPLAAEPYAAALDLVCTFVISGFARGPAIALLRSPQFEFSATCAAADISALARTLSEAGYLGELEPLERLVRTWGAAADGRTRRAARAGAALIEAARELSALRTPAPPAIHLSALIRFLSAHERPSDVEPPVQARHLRARAAVTGTMQCLRLAYERFDSRPVAFDEVAALLRRWVDNQTFAPRSGESGVHVVDADSARFGAFDLIQIAGLVEGEWPDRPRRNIFYSPGILRELGWPSEADRLQGARAAFADLLRLPLQGVAASAFTLESDALVSPSPLVDEIERAGLTRREERLPAVRVFDHEALAQDPIERQPLGAAARSWLEHRLAFRPAERSRYQGFTAGHQPSAYSLSALERYQDCPFKFFGADVLALEEEPEDESALSPRARGRFVHEVFQRFFEAWDARGEGTITPDRLEAARNLLAEVAEPLLAKLPDAALEHTRLFGSAISVGIADVVVGIEASRPDPVRERWLEYRFDGAFTLGAPDGRQVPITGVADRIDLLSGNRLRVIDYKSGYAPNPRRALQVPIYALCAQERLTERDRAQWAVDEAAYVALGGKRSFVPVVKPGSDADAVLASARARLHTAVDAIERGEFPPRPHDSMICRYCAYAAVCRKDYVELD